MAKDMKYIRKRKRKYGFAFLIDIPFTDENGVVKHFTETVKLPDFPNEKSALLAAQKIRNDALIEIQSGRLKRSLPTVSSLYKRKWDLLPMSINTHEKQDAIYAVLKPFYERFKKNGKLYVSPTSRPVIAAKCLHLWAFLFFSRKRSRKTVVFCKIKQGLPLPSEERCTAQTFGYKPSKFSR